MVISPEQRKIINSPNPRTVSELNGAEVFVLFALGKMHGKVVRIASTLKGTITGVFHFEHLNGNYHLDFVNPLKWENIKCSSISLSIQFFDEKGHVNGLRFKNEAILQIKNIRMLMAE